MTRTIRPAENVTARYDPEVDAFAVDFEGSRPGASVRQTRLDERRAIDFNAEGEPIGVEVLFASTGVAVEGFPCPELVVAAAVRLGLPVTSPPG